MLYSSQDSRGAVNRVKRVRQEDEWARSAIVERLGVGGE